MALSPGERRVLRFLAEYPGWHSTVELTLLRTMEDGDAYCVPVLEQRGLVEQMRQLDWVRVTPAGRVIAEEQASNPAP